MLCTDGVSKYETNSGEHLNLLHNVLCVSLTDIFYRIFAIFNFVSRHVRQEKL